MGTPQERTPMSIERILLIVVSVLLVIAIIFIVINQFAGRSKEEAQETAAEEPTLAAAAPTLPPAAPTEAPMAAPTEEAAAAPEANPTSGVQRLAIDPTPTPFMVSSDDPRTILNLGNPDYTDFFNDPKTWYVYGTDKSNGQAEYRIEGGQLIGTDFDAEDTSLYWSYTSAQSGRVYAEISATNGDCAARDAVGLVVRVQADVTPSGYALEVACDGSYRFIRFRAAGRPTSTLIDWTPSGAIQQGQGATNRLGIWGYDGNFYLFVNNTQIDHFFDNGMPYSYGFFAAYVRAQVSYPLSASFDDFAFWHLPFIP
ncbi:MAG: hypothetical protein P8X64_04970 [Anaerolineales bacterium]|jgi:hypothetical protein